MSPVKVEAKNDELAKMIARMKELELENAALRAKPATRVSYKVSEKGACSVYGLGRFPVTLYKEQWEKLLADAQLKAFLADPANKFSTKADKDARDAATKAGGGSATAPATGKAL